MEKVLRKYLLLLIMVMIVWSCGKSGDISRITALEKHMSEVQDPAGKTELANRLHREYALYHLRYEDDTLFLRDWARMAESGREYEEAIDVYNMLLERGGGAPGVYQARARLLAGLGYYIEASGDFGRAAEMTASSAPAKRTEYAYWSEYYHKADSVIQSEGALIAESKDRTAHLLNRAAQYMKCGYYSAAVADIRPVLASDSANARAHYLLAATYLASGELERSEEVFTKYFAVAVPEDENFAEAVEQQQRLNLMVQLRDLESALKSEPYSYQYLVDASAIAFRLENYNKALVYATRLTEVFPDSIFGYLYRGQVRIQQAKPGQSLADLNRVLALDPSNISARNLRAYVFLLNRDEDALRREIEEIAARGGVLLDVLRPYAADNEK